MKYPKKPRLKNFEYSGPNIYFVTLRTANNKEVFTTELSVSETHAILKACTNKHAFGIIAYCYMPDHLHVLIEGKQESNLKKFMKDFQDYPYIGSETLDLKDFLTAEPDELGKPT